MDPESTQPTESVTAQQPETDDVPTYEDTPEPVVRNDPAEPDHTVEQPETD